MTLQAASGTTTTNQEVKDKVSSWVLISNAALLYLVRPKKQDTKVSSVNASCQHSLSLFNALGPWKCNQTAVHKHLFDIEKPSLA